MFVPGPRYDQLSRVMFRTLGMKLDWVSRSPSFIVLPLKYSSSIGSKRSGNVLAQLNTNSGLP